MAKLYFQGCAIIEANKIDFAQPSVKANNTSIIMNDKTYTIAVKYEDFERQWIKALNREDL